MMNLKRHRSFATPLRPLAIMTSPTLADLHAALHRYKLNIEDDCGEPLVDFCRLLWDWNSRINLTRHTDMDAFVCRDLLDTLRLAGHIPAGSSILDVGSGGGVPGIPLAILRPDLTVALAESVAKKAKVLAAMVQDLELPIKVYADRAEKVLKSQQFDLLTLRAVAPLRKLLFWFRMHPDSFGHLLMIKGPRWVAEFEEAKLLGLADNVNMTVIDEYPTPGHDSNSVILSVTFARRED